MRESSEQAPVPEPGQVPGPEPGQVPGPEPGQVPGQVPGQEPGQVLGQVPGTELEPRSEPHPNPRRTHHLLLLPLATATSNDGPARIESISYQLPYSRVAMTGDHLDLTEWSIGSYG